MLQQLQNITENILQANTEQQNYFSVKALYDFYTQHFFTEDNFEPSNTVLKSGIAVHPIMAADCVKDYNRTTKFLQGIFTSIKSLQSFETAKPINILYAGCGPLATLIVPLLPFLKNEIIAITFIDVHTKAIQNVQKILQQLGLQHCVNKMLAIDICQFDTNEKFDLIISETMLAGLVSEPQTNVTAHLLPMLNNNGIFIPQTINIHLVLTKYAATKQFHQPKKFENNFVDKKEEQLFFEDQTFLFSIGKNGTLNFNNGTKSFETKTFATPIFGKEEIKDIVLLTEIVVYDNFIVEHSASQITNPICIGTCNNLNNAANFSLEYNYATMPTWVIKEK